MTGRPVTMDWDNVRVFLAVARAGQFVAGAKLLHLDHATASRRVAALETALGAKLFDRRTTGARLTSSGERFLLAAEQMESAFLHAQAEVSDIDVELTGEVRIGAPDGFSTYYLAGALRDFVQKNPGVRVQLAPLPQLTPLARREVDIVVGLGRHRLIGYVEEYAFSTALDYVRELYGGAPTNFECASAVTQLEALRAGVGLGVVHDYIARRFDDLVRVLPERGATRAYWIVTHQDTRGMGRIRAVHDHLVASVERDRAMFTR